MDTLGRTDFPAFRNGIQALLAGIPHSWHAKDNLGHYEAWYASLLLCFSEPHRMIYQVEELSSHGCSGIVLLREGRCLATKNQIFWKLVLKHFDLLTI